MFDFFFVLPKYFSEVSLFHFEKAPADRIETVAIRLITAEAGYTLREFVSVDIRHDLQTIGKKIIAASETV